MYCTPVAERSNGDVMFPINDLLDAILLGGFLFGLIFTVGTLLLGVADIGFHGDHGHDFDMGSSGEIFHGMFNLSAILAFITWFGGIGYLFRNAAGWNAFLSVFLGLAGGLAGAFVVSWFMVKVLRPSGQVLDPKDYETVGRVARVTSSIREGGVGEIVFELGCTRHVAGAKSVNPQAISRGTEVVVLRMERGMAVVEPFEDLLAEGH
jgi:membrane protein implicated in regulation of membrane protease activity